MIAKISSTANLSGALGYNFKKVVSGEASILLAEGLYATFERGYTMDEVLLCGLSRPLLSRHQRRQGGENHLAKDLGSTRCGLCPLLSQLVAISVAHRQGRCRLTLHLYPLCGLYLSPHGWSMDEPITQK